jgi:small subunit ribosomal protein S4
MVQKRQKTLRRLERWGSMPAWTRKPLLKRRLNRPWLVQGDPNFKRMSPWGRRLWEKQRLKFNYNINERTMTRLFRLAVQQKHPVVALIQMLESRTDNILWRIGAAASMAEGRDRVKFGNVQYRRAGDLDKGEEAWRTTGQIQMMKPGDQIRIQSRANPKMAKTRAEQRLEEEGNVQIPDHLDFDRENLMVTYRGLCDPSDFGIMVEEKFIFQWYAGQGTKNQKSVRRTHYRYFRGTDRVIPKQRVGRIRDTPENRINMKFGIGLRMRGRHRPPGLWGRKMPLNNAYEGFGMPGMRRGGQRK